MTGVPRSLGWKREVGGGRNPSLVKDDNDQRPTGVGGNIGVEGGMGTLVRGRNLRETAFMNFVKA